MLGSIRSVARAVASLAQAAFTFAFRPIPFASFDFVLDCSISLSIPTAPIMDFERVYVICALLFSIPFISLLLIRTYSRFEMSNDKTQYPRLVEMQMHGLSGWVQYSSNSLISHRQLKPY